MILDKIAEHKRAEVEQRKKIRPIESLISEQPDSATRDFAAAIRLEDGCIPKVIAEVKKASPSKGVIRPDFDPVMIAESYSNAGASALSVLTDERFFQGHLDYLTACRDATPLPVLRKDFIIDEYQIYEARIAGADAILLIAALLSCDYMRKLRQLAQSLGMASLVEVHDEHELESALRSGAAIIGINNRNLQTFVVRLDTTFELRPKIPAGITVVSESGISDASQLKELACVGVDAVLVGESLMRADDPGIKLKELIDI